MAKTGCQRQFPANFPALKAADAQIRRWRDTWLSEHIAQALREQGRRASGRNATLTVVVIDLQSAKSAGKGNAWLRRGQEDQGLQAANRRRYQGNLLTAVAHSAGIQDSVAARIEGLGFYQAPARRNRFTRSSLTKLQRMTSTARKKEVEMRGMRPAQTSSRSSCHGCARQQLEWEPSIELDRGAEQQRQEAEQRPKNCFYYE